MFGQGTVGERYGSAGTLEQRFGDEETEAHALVAAWFAAFLAIARPAGDEGVAQLVKDILLEAGAVVPHRDRHL